MEEYTQKWAIVSLLEDIKEGSEFHYTDFPLHLTLAGVFAIDKNGQQLVNELTELLRGQHSLEIEAEKKDMFGPEKNVAVMRIKKTSELLKLYELIYRWLEGAGVKYNSPEYQGVGYLPHSTFRKSGSLSQGEKRRVRSISLIDLFPDDDAYKRKVFKTIELL